MANNVKNVKNATYRVFNGTNWDDVYFFKTSATQVGETTNLKFLHLDKHTVNGIAFGASSGITITGENIVFSSSDSTTLYTKLNTINTTLGNLIGAFDTLDGEFSSLSNTVTEAINEFGAEVADVGADVATVKTAVGNKIDKTSIGVKNGVASLDANGKVPSSQLPSFVDDVIEGYLSNDGKSFVNDSGATLTGETGKIYVHKGTNKTYRWSGSAYVEISSGGVALGDTSSTAYAGDRGVKLETFVSKVGLTKSDGTYEDYVAKAKSDKDGNQINTTYQKQTLGSNIVVNGNTTNANTVVGVLTNLATYCNGISGTISTLGSTYAKTGDVHKISSGDTAPTNAKQWDIWLDTSA